MEDALVFTSRRFLRTRARETPLLIRKRRLWCSSLYIRADFAVCLCVPRCVIESCTFFWSSVWKSFTFVSPRNYTL
jgi:hypothetical protein